MGRRERFAHRQQRVAEGRCGQRPKGVGWLEEEVEKEQQRRATASAAVRSGGKMGGASKRPLGNPLSGPAAGGLPLMDEGARRKRLKQAG